MKRLALAPVCLALLAASPAVAGEDVLLLCGFEEVFALSPETLASGKGVRHVSR